MQDDKIEGVRAIRAIRKMIVLPVTHSLEWSHLNCDYVIGIECFLIRYDVINILWRHKSAPVIFANCFDFLGSATVDDEMPPHSAALGFSRHRNCHNVVSNDYNERIHNLFLMTHALYFYSFLFAFR